MTRRIQALALALAAVACDCRGGPALWVGALGEPVVLVVAGDEGERVVASPPALDTAVRALLVRRDRAVVVLQEPLAGDPAAPMPPAVLLSPHGSRLAAFAGTDGSGARLFTAAAPPWAAAEDASGRVWITGGVSPVVYAADGTLATVAQPLAYPTRAVAVLPDGRVAVSYGVEDVAIYAWDGTVVDSMTATLCPSCQGIGALLPEAGPTLVAATLRFGVSSDAVLVRLALGPGSLAAVPGAPAPAPLGAAIPAALVAAEGRILVGPSLSPLAPGACPRWVSADLAQDGGCAAPGAHRGVAWQP